MKSILKNNHISIRTRRKAAEWDIEPNVWMRVLDSFKTVTKKKQKKKQTTKNNKNKNQQQTNKQTWRHQKCGSFEKCCESHRLQRNLTKQCYEKPTQKRSSLINTWTPSNLVWPCDEKRESRTSCDNCNDDGKRSRGKQREMKLEGLIVAQSKKSDRSTLKATGERE